MPLLLSLTAGDPDRDPRARRAALAARAAGLEVCEVDTRRRREHAARAAGRYPRELRGLVRLAGSRGPLAQLVRRGRHARPDIVHAHDLDTLPAGWLLARRAKARLVYDAHELYTGFDADPPRLWLAAIAALEGALARRADAVITVSEQIADELVRRHRLPRRPLVVLNCPPVDGAPVREPCRRAAGDLPGGRRPRPRAPRPPPLAALPGRRRRDAASSATSRRRRASSGSTPCGQDELVAALEPFDVGLVIDRTATDNTRLALPNKLFEYLMAGLAVVVPDAPAMAALVETRGRRAGLPSGPARRGRSPARHATAAETESCAAGRAGRPLERLQRRGAAAGCSSQPGGSRCAASAASSTLERPAGDRDGARDGRASSATAGPTARALFEAARRRARPRADSRSSTSPTAGRQPFASADGALQLLHNGEVFNYVELRAELERAGRRFRSATDTEVVLAAYERMGRALRRAIQRHVGDRALGRPRAGGSSARAIDSGSSRSTTAGTGAASCSRASRRRSARDPRAPARAEPGRGSRLHRAGIRRPPRRDVLRGDPQPAAGALPRRRRSGLRVHRYWQLEPGRAAGRSCRPRSASSSSTRSASDSGATCRSGPRSRAGSTRRPSR